MPAKPILKPLFDRAFIEFEIDPDKPVEKIGDLVMPSGFVPKPNKEGFGLPYYQAAIVAIGPDVKQLKVGDIIVIPRDRVERFSVGEHDWCQITEKSVVGIVAQ